MKEQQFDLIRMSEEQVKMGVIAPVLSEYIELRRARAKTLMYYVSQEYPKSMCDILARDIESINEKIRKLLTV